MSIDPFDDDLGIRHEPAQDGDAETPEEFVRHFRSRVFADVTGDLYEVRDTLERPFTTPGFPRGTLLLEAVEPDRPRLAAAYTAWRKDKGMGDVDVEPISSPAERWRSRLFRLNEYGETDRDGPRYVEVRDTVAEPCEYRHAMPDGELLATVEDFSIRYLRRQMNARRTELGVPFAGTWKTKIHV